MTRGVVMLWALALCVAGPLGAQTPVAFRPSPVGAAQIARRERSALVVQPAASANARGPASIDSLVALLDSANFRARAGGVAGLAAQPADRLPNVVAAKLMTLLDREGVANASGAALGAGPVSEADAEDYGEYIVALTDLVLAFNDRAAVRGLALIGIQTSRDAQQFVAAQGAAALPLLDSVYAGSSSSAPAVVKTWAYVLRPRPGSSLGAADSVRVLSRILGSADVHPIAFSAAARIATLVDAAPVLEQIGAQTKDATVAAISGRTAAQLRVLRQQQPTAVRVGQMGVLLETLCANPAADRARCAAVTDSLRALRQSGSEASAQQRMINLSAQLGSTGGLAPREATILEDARRDLSTRRAPSPAPPR